MARWKGYSPGGVGGGRSTSGMGGVFVPLAEGAEHRRWGQRTSWPAACALAPWSLWAAGCSSSPSHQAAAPPTAHASKNMSFKGTVSRYRSCFFLAEQNLKLLKTTFRPPDLQNINWQRGLCHLKEDLHYSIPYSKFTNPKMCGKSEFIKGAVSQNGWTQALPKIISYCMI